MSSFRKRKNPVLHSGFHDVRYRVEKIHDDDVISQVTSSDLRFSNPSPTLDEQLKAGVSIKEVPTNGILDSYDVNDTPLLDLEEKIVTKGRKKNNVESKNDE